MWFQQCTGPGAGPSEAPAPVLVPVLVSEMLRCLTGADLGKDPSPRETGQGRDWLVLHDRKIKFEVGSDPWRARPGSPRSILRARPWPLSRQGPADSGPASSASVPAELLTCV